MSFLVIMEIRWEVYGGVSGFEYSFVDFLINGYSGQYHVQVAAVIHLDVDKLQYHQLSTLSQ